MAPKAQADRSTRSLFVLTLLSAAGLAVLIALGIWQVQRLGQKQALIATVQARVNLPAMDLAAAGDWNKLDLGELEYRPVRIKGRFLHEREMPLFTHLSKPKGRFGGPGYWIVTPLVTERGTILINRGFVPQAQKEQAARQAGQTAGTVALTGLLRRSETPRLFTPENKPENNEWYFRDAAAMALHINLSNVGPFFIDQTGPLAKGGLPQVGETRLHFANSHLQYAFTWFALAACLLGVYSVFVYRGVKA